MENKFKYSTIKVIFTSVVSAAQFTIVAYFASLFLKNELSVIATIGVFAVFVLIFVYVNAVVVEVDKDCIKMSRFNRVYRTIPMNSYSISSYIVSHTYRGFSTGTDYHIAILKDESQTYETKYQCYGFTKETFENLMGSIAVFFNERSKEAV